MLGYVWGSGSGISFRTSMSLRSVPVPEFPEFKICSVQDRFQDTNRFGIMKTGMGLGSVQNCFYSTSVVLIRVRIWA